MAFCPSCGQQLAGDSSACSNCGTKSESGLAVAEAPESWKVILSDRGIVFAESESGYAVYDQTVTFGRWPKTSEGHRFATESFGAHAQSAAHGIAYEAAGYQDPIRLGLPTDPVLKSTTYASPMSYVGSTRRIAAWAKGVAQRNSGLAAVAWTAAILAMLLMWSVVTMWYFITFGLFGILMIPWRLIRRSQRKSQHIQRTTLATQQAMLQQQQAMLQQHAMMQQQVSQQHAQPLLAPSSSPPEQLPPG